MYVCLFVCIYLCTKTTWICIYCMYVIYMINKQALHLPVYCITLNAPICTRIHIHTRTTTCNVPLWILKSKWNAIRSGCRAQAGRFHGLIFKCVCFLFGTARWFGDSAGGRLQTIHHRASAHQSGYPPCATPLNIRTHVRTYINHNIWKELLQLHTVHTFIYAYINTSIWSAAHIHNNIIDTIALIVSINIHIHTYIHTYTSYRERSCGLRSTKRPPYINLQRWSWEKQEVLPLPYMVFECIVCMCCIYSVMIYVRVKNKYVCRGFFSWFYMYCMYVWMNGSLQVHVCMYSM